MPDNEDRAIRQALSVPGDSIAGNISRRRFLQGSLATAGAVGTMGVLAACDPAVPGNLNDGILIVLHLGGGNDGYNTVVPMGDSPYLAKRSNIAITNPLPLAGGFGLHPALPKLRDRFNAGKVAIVQGVGQAGTDDLSHFSSTASWMAGTAGPSRTSGWLGRWLDTQPGASGGLRGVAIGTSVPLHLVGQQAVVTSLDTGGDLFGSDRSQPYLTSGYDTVVGYGSAPTGKGPWADALAKAGKESVNLATTLAPQYSPDLPPGPLTSQLTLVARLINANLGIRVFDTALGSFDTHDNQQYQQNVRLIELDTAIDAFYAALSPAMSRKVTLMTFSEFGRRAQSNASGGTDHGTSSCLFVVGDNVRGGFFGQFPRLDDLDGRGDPKVWVDYRSVYASVLAGWLGADTRSVLGGTYADLGLFARLPGGS
jgi:uncharacterized protein (DUF1501 family)